MLRSKSFGQQWQLRRCAAIQESSLILLSCLHDTKCKSVLCVLIQKGSSCSPSPHCWLWFPKRGGFPKVGLVLSEHTRRIALLEDSTTPVAQVTSDLHLLKIAAAWLGNGGHGAPASCTIGARLTAFHRNYTHTHTQTHVFWSAHMLAHGCNFPGVKNWNDGLTKITAVWSFLTVTILLIVLSFVL